MEDTEGQPSFRQALLELASRGKILKGLSQQSLNILPHAIISVGWALIWRDLSALLMVPESKVTQSRSSLMTSLQTWVDHVGANLEEPLLGDSPCDVSGIPMAYMGDCGTLSIDPESI